jgi:serine protease AprX
MEKIRRTISKIVCTAFLVGLLGPAALPASWMSARAQPLLAQIAAVDPQEQVSVIVQKAGAGAVEELVEALGGRITKDLSIINGFAAEMMAADALELASREGVRWVSLDAAVEESARKGPSNATPSESPTPGANTYLDTLGVHRVWSMGIDGSGIGVAVIDSGISNNNDLNLEAHFTFNSNSHSDIDFYGHGTHVAGIIAGDGDLSAKKYMGVAPGVNLYSLKVCDDTGMAYESDVVAAMQWVYTNKSAFNIRVVNLSLNSTVEQDYHTSPLDAAAEILWFNGVVVVVSSGNASSSLNLANTPPANDPFVITVGAADEKATSRYTDDEIAAYTAWTTTSSGFLKPDIFAPGSNIISLLSSQSSWGSIAPDRVVDTYYFRLSGTSLAAPMVTGTVALLLQDEPDLTPDQVKYRLLKATSRKLTHKVTNRLSYSWPYLDTYAAVTGKTTASANTGQTASQLLWSGSDPITWGSVAWNSVAWNSVAWNSVAWNSVAWNSVAWNSAYWGE